MTRLLKGRKILLGGLMMGLAHTSVAKVFLDHEVHPIPLVDITVILPTGFETNIKEDVGAANILSDILEGGTQSKDRQAFLDALASYGASSSFAVSNQYSYLRMSFPLLDGKDYQGLAQIVAENWQTPRWTEENFKLAVLKLEAAFSGSLDSDMSLGVSSARRWLNKKSFHGHPVVMESLKALTLEKTRSFFEKKYHRKFDEVWVGVIGPEKAAPVVELILKALFPEQGDWVKGERLKVMKPEYQADASGVKTTHTALILDKSGRNQTVSSFLAVNPHRLDDDDDLAFQFGNHILVDSGLGSLFGDEIRNKRGLAYSVSGVHSFYLGYPVLGFAANPVRERTDEAFGVFATLMKDSFQEADVFEKVPQELWDRQWQSFTYARILDRSTPGGRLGERMSIVTGTQSPELYTRPVQKWKVSREETRELFQKHWKSSTVLAAFVGNEKEVRPLVEKHFPDFEVRVIPYQQSIHAEAYGE